LYDANVTWEDDCKWVIYQQKFKRKDWKLSQIMTPIHKIFGIAPFGIAVIGITTASPVKH
jgi:hypothetical protein